jgi:hypothetical protein
MRAKSGPESPNWSIIRLFNGPDLYNAENFYSFYIQGLSFRRTEFDAYLNGSESFYGGMYLGTEASQWHNYKWERNEQGLWTHYVDDLLVDTWQYRDGSITSPVYDNSITSFTGIMLWTTRDQSEIEWVRVETNSGTTPPPTPAKISGWISFCDRKGIALDGRKDIIPRKLKIVLWRDEDDQTIWHQWPAIRVNECNIYNPTQASEFQYSIDVSGWGLKQNQSYAMGVSVYGVDFKKLCFEMPQNLIKADMNFRLTYEDVIDSLHWIKGCRQKNKIKYTFVPEEFNDLQKEAIRRALRTWEKTDIYSFVENSTIPNDIQFRKERTKKGMGGVGEAVAPYNTVQPWTIDFAKDKVWETNSFLNFYWNNYWSGAIDGELPLERVALHEIGHVLGLRYPTSPLQKEDEFGDSSTPKQDWSIMDYLGQPVWPGWSDVAALRKLNNKSVVITGLCPIDLKVTDNEGNIISKDANEIPGATYVEEDLDGDGDLDDEIIIPEPNTGAYFIQVIPDSNADPNAPVTLTIEDHGNATILLDEVPVSELPTEPLVVNIDRTAPQLQVYADPQVLVPVNGQMVPVAIDIDINDNDPNVEVVLVGITSSNPNDVNFVADANIGIDDREFSLRASADTNDTIYTITYAAKDSSDNVAYATTNVIVPSIKASLEIMPCVINRDDGHNCHEMDNILAFIRLPEGITKNDIDSNEPLTLYPGGIETSWQWVIPCGDGKHKQKLVGILAFFNKDAILDATPDNGRVELQVVGRLNCGQYFYGCDTVKIIGRHPCDKHNACDKH